MTSTFAAGEVYSKTGTVDKVGRIYGSGIGSAKVTPGRCFAYEGQLVNGQLQKEKLDAYGPVSYTHLSGEDTRSFQPIHGFYTHRKNTFELLIKEDADVR